MIMMIMMIMTYSFLHFGPEMHDITPCIVGPDMYEPSQAAHIASEGQCRNRHHFSSPFLPGVLNKGLYLHPFL